MFLNTFLKLFMCFFYLHPGWSNRDLSLKANRNPSNVFIKQWILDIGHKRTQDCDLLKNLRNKVRSTIASVYCLACEGYNQRPGGLPR